MELHLCETCGRHFARTFEVQWDMVLDKWMRVGIKHCTNCRARNLMPDTSARSLFAQGQQKPQASRKSRDDIRREAAERLLAEALEEMKYGTLPTM